MAEMRTMTGDREAIFPARKLVARMTARYGSDVSSTAELLTDELVTNAVLHGGGTFTLVAVVDPVGCRLRVTVFDRGSEVALVPDHSATLRPGGRGLAVVDALATSWGIQPLGEAKSVWFELLLDG